jgi:hypothetical protein
LKWSNRCVEACPNIETLYVWTFCINVLAAYEM